jgi:hypothetical protein
MQSPLGASEKICAPHFRQILMVCITATDLFKRSLYVLRKILSDITSGRQRLGDEVHHQCHRRWQPCERFLLAIVIDNAAGTDETLV